MGPDSSGLGEVLMEGRPRTLRTEEGHLGVQTPGLPHRDSGKERGSGGAHRGDILARTSLLRAKCC